MMSLKMLLQGLCFTSLVLGRVALAHQASGPSSWGWNYEGEETESFHTRHSQGLEPSFVTQIQNQTVSVGRDVILGCHVKDLGSNFKVGWLKVSDQTILTLHKRVITHNSRIRVTHDEQRTWNLVIKNVQPEDEGCYMCQINTLVMKKELGCVSVLVSPDIQLERTSSDTTVNEGEDATLVCHATGRPQPSIIWRREDGKTFHVKNTKRYVKDYGGEFLVLHKVRRKDMGAFLCIARNDVPPSVSKRIILNVNFPPNVSLDHQLVGSPIGEKVSLRCMVEAYPTAITYWVRQGSDGKEEMLLNRPNFNIEEQKLDYRTEVTLTIDVFTKDDEGIYTCVSTNSIGLKESTVRVYELVQPTITTKLTSTVPSTTPVRNMEKTTIVNKLPSKKTISLNISRIDPTENKHIKPSLREGSSWFSAGNRVSFESTTFFLSISFLACAI